MTDVWIEVVMVIMAGLCAAITFVGLLVLVVEGELWRGLALTTCGVIGLTLSLMELLR